MYLHLKHDNVMNMLLSLCLQKEEAALCTPSIPSPGEKLPPVCNPFEPNVTAAQRIQLGPLESNAAKDAKIDEQDLESGTYATVLKQSFKRSS
jgi:hypothetical protein